MYHLTQERWEERKSEYTDDQREQAWSKTADIVKTYSDEIVRRWNQEIDTLLVFVRLHVSRYKCRIDDTP